MRENRTSSLSGGRRPALRRASSDPIVERMRTSVGNIGFDAARGEYVDLIAAGIIDPTKVVRIALENAVSVASVLLLTEATLTEVPEPKADGAPALAES